MIQFMRIIHIFLFLLLLSNEVLFAYDATKIKEKLTPGKGE